MNAFNVMQAHSFSIIFAVIVLLAATPKGYAFWQYAQQTNTDTKLKMEMLKMGFSADEIVRTLLSQREREPRSQQA